MSTSNFSNALCHSFDKCNNFFTSCNVPYKITKNIPDFSFDLLLDIYCEKKAFYQISRNKLYENVEIVSSRDTLKKYYNFFRNDLKHFPNFNNYTFDFLYNSFTEENKANKKGNYMGDKLHTYNDCVLGIIIGNWKYMPFNPRYLSSTGRFGNASIPASKYSIFFELNNIENKNLSTNFDKLVYIFLTDHFFNINLLCQFIYFSRDWGVRKDYGTKLHDYCFAISAIIVSALRELPSWSLKYFFLENFQSNFKCIIRKNMSKDFLELLEKTATDIYNFSLVYYPMYKLLFKKHLCSELNIEKDDEIVFSKIKNFLSLDAKRHVNLYPDYSIEFMKNENLKEIDDYLLTVLTKDFYSMYKAEFPSNDKKYPPLKINTNSTIINNYYKKVNQIVRCQIKEIRGIYL